MFFRLILRPTYLIVVRSVFRLSSDSQAQVSKLLDFELHYSNILLVERVAYPFDSFMHPESGYTKKIVPINFKGDNFCDFLFVSLLTKSLLKRGLQ